MPVRDADLASEAITALSGAGIALAHFSLGQPTLDEVFLALTGHATDAETADQTHHALQEDAA